MKRDEIEWYTLLSDFGTYSACNGHDGITDFKCDTKFYEKSEADKVMDGYEDRIHFLENAEHFLLRKCKECKDVIKALADIRAALGIDPRFGTTPKDLCNKIKELKAENARLNAEIERENKLIDFWGIEGLLNITENNKELRSENARLKAQVQKWISVNDRMPMPLPPITEEK